MTQTYDFDGVCAIDTWLAARVLYLFWPVRRWPTLFGIGMKWRTALQRAGLPSPPPILYVVTARLETDRPCTERFLARTYPQCKVRLFMRRDLGETGWQFKNRTVSGLARLQGNAVNHYDDERQYR